MAVPSEVTVEMLHDQAESLSAAVLNYLDTVEAGDEADDEADEEPEPVAVNAEPS